MVSIVIDFSGYAKKRRLRDAFFKENAVSYFTTSS